jgi:hypothetical protein
MAANSGKLQYTTHSINQNQIRFNVAISEALPIAEKWVINMLGVQWLVALQH